MCIGLQTLKVDKGIEYTVVVAVRGYTQNEVNITVDFNEGGKLKTRVYNKQIPSNMVPNLNNLDIFSSMKYSVQWIRVEGSKNLILDILGGYIFVAFDWVQKDQSY